MLSRSPHRPVLWIISRNTSQKGSGGCFHCCLLSCFVFEVLDLLLRMIQKLNFLETVLGGTPPPWSYPLQGGCLAATAGSAVCPWPTALADQMAFLLSGPRGLRQEPGRAARGWSRSWCLMGHRLPLIVMIPDGDRHLRTVYPFRC